jgi:hypothetical protein
MNKNNTAWKLEEMEVISEDDDTNDNEVNSKNE